MGRNYMGHGYVGPCLASERQERAAREELVVFEQAEARAMVACDPDDPGLYSYGPK